MNDDFITNIEHYAPLGKSDHSVLIASCDVFSVHTGVVQATLNYSKGDYQKFKTFPDLDWKYLFKDTSKDVESM